MRNTTEMLQRIKKHEHWHLCQIRNKDKKYQFLNTLSLVYVILVTVDAG